MIFFIDAGDNEYVEEYIDGFPRYETARICELVVAETRGKAKSLFLKHSKDTWLEWKDKMKIWKISNDNLGFKAGVISQGLHNYEDKNDPISILWEAVAVKERNAK